MTETARRFRAATATRRWPSCRGAVRRVTAAGGRRMRARQAPEEPLGDPVPGAVDPAAGVRRLGAVDAAGEHANNLRTPPDVLYIRHVIASNAITMTVRATTSSCCPSRSQLEFFGLLMHVCTVNDLDRHSRERRSVQMATGANRLNRVIPSHLVVRHARRALVHKDAVPIGRQAVRSLADDLSGSQRQPQEQA